MGTVHCLLKSFFTERHFSSFQENLVSSRRSQHDSSWNHGGINGMASCGPSSAVSGSFRGRLAGMTVSSLSLSRLVMRLPSCCGAWWPTTLCPVLTTLTLCRFFVVISSFSLPRPPTVTCWFSSINNASHIIVSLLSGKVVICAHGLHFML
jgi:hypothetical protein